MTKFYAFIAIAFLSFGQLVAQKQVQLNINHLLGESSLSSTAVGTNDLGNKFNVGRLQYYLSQISLIHDGGTVTSCDSVYLLVNANEGGRFLIGEYDLTEIEAIDFILA